MGKYLASVEDHLVLPAVVRLPSEQETLQRRAGRSVPAPVAVRLLIDTGAKRTTVIPGIVRHLQPYSGSSARVVSSLGTLVTDLVWLCFEFPDADLAAFPEVLVARLPMPPKLAQFHGLLGRDLLRRLESFEYEGRRGGYTIRDSPGLFPWLRRWL